MLARVGLTNGIVRASKPLSLLFFDCLLDNRKRLSKLLTKKKKKKWESLVLARHKQKEKNDLLHEKKSQDLFCLREQQWIAHTAYQALRDDNDGDFDIVTGLHNSNTEEGTTTYVA